MQYFRQLMFSLIFFTRVRVPIKLDLSGITLGACAWSFPLIGAFVGAVSALVYIAFVTLGLSPAASAWLAVIVQILLTGGLHEDGLADSADAAAYDRDTKQKLNIMRDSRIGSFGVLALICIIGLRTNLIGALQETIVFSVLVASAIASRCSMAILMFISPRAREEGMAVNAGGINAKNLAVCFGITTLALFSLLELTQALTTLGVSVIASLYAKRIAVQQFGGITGDVIGAVQQLSEILVLIFLLLLVVGS